VLQTVLMGPAAPHSAEAAASLGQHWVGVYIGAYNVSHSVVVLMLGCLCTTKRGCWLGVGHAPANRVGALQRPNSCLLAGVNCTQRCVHGSVRLCDPAAAMGAMGDYSRT
jgi:hypothetical protein